VICDMSVVLPGCMTFSYWHVLFTFTNTFDSARIIAIYVIYLYFHVYIRVQPRFGVGSSTLIIFLVLFAMFLFCMSSICFLLDFVYTCIWIPRTELTFPQKRKFLITGKFFKDLVTDIYVQNVFLCTDIHFMWLPFTGQKYFHTKIFPYIFHIKPLIFKTFSWSHSLSDFLDIFTLKSIYDLNININSRRHNFLWSYRKIWWKQSNFVFKSCHKEKYE
jgi:hypothetical protein